MKLSDFDYELPKELIAQTALPERSDARLLVLDRKTQTVKHKTFRKIIDYLNPGDVLVLNDTKVLPARIFAKRKTGGNVEMLVLENPAVIARNPVEGGTTKQSQGVTDQSVSFPRKRESMSCGSPIKAFGDDNDEVSRYVRDGRKICQVLLKPSRRVKQGEELILDEKSKLAAKVLDAPDGETGIRHIEFQTEEPLETILDQIGHIPLPPYIDRPDQPVDRELYQTVFAKNPGAVASPTAGLHFDELLLDEIRRKSVEIVFVTLHVGYGTFQPVAVEDLKQHEMHEEYYEISRETAERINRAKAEGRRIIACGTTVVRTLEATAEQLLLAQQPSLRATEGSEAILESVLCAEIASAPPGSLSRNDGKFAGTTNLFIYPPYQFKMIDAMITNFHLPRTTLLMLTSAFAGQEFLMCGYQEAIQNQYRFFSYGDAMLIL